METLEGGIEAAILMKVELEWGPFATQSGMKKGRSGIIPANILLHWVQC